MDMKSYNDMMGKIHSSKEIDEMVRENVLKTIDTNRMKGNMIKKRLLATAAVLAVVICIGQIQPVKASVDRLVNYITYHITIQKEDGIKEKIEVKESFLTISENAPTSDMFLGSVSEAGDLSGIDLLDSTEAYSYKGCVEYAPKLTEDESIYGIVITDKLYAVGDLKNTKLYPKEEEDGLDFLEYTPGSEYRTPIMTQIAIRTDENLDAEYQDNELGYVGSALDVDFSDSSSGVSDAEVYYVDKLGINAVLFTVQTDGPINWHVESGTEDCCTALFVYKGVEYMYMGGVSHDTMKAFLNTLE